MSVKIAISSYSFHRFGGGPEGNDAPSIEQMIDRCVELGVDGIELLWEHLTLNDKATPDALHELHQYAAIRGITPVTVAASHNPVQTTPEARAAELDKLNRTVDAASALGAPFVRAHGGRWHTIPNFKEMWDNRGEEPAAEGYTLEQSYDWAIEALKKGAEYAGSKGVTLVLENHWGLTGTAEGTKRTHDGVNSPWLKYVLDTGNFFHLPDPYAEMEVFFPDLAILHAKVYLGGAMIPADPEIDYVRIASMLGEIDYNGYVSIEFEGKAHPDEGIPDGILTVRTAFRD
ncbi:MAG: sugar phosphate isomerase/epimerase [Chloroflexia bacterium]|nr:sugar phosphate isomerase/epimerase [Chloroflexia bacterium]